jgi:transposase InsO family protein
MEAKLAAVFTAGLSVQVNVVCAELGISRQTFYKYRRRWLAEGPAGLLERSRRPHNSPGAVSAEVEDAIVRLRKERLVDNGAQHIAWELERRPELGPAPSARTVHRVLVRRGLVTPEPKKRPHVATRRFEWPQPNSAWQIDATMWALADGAAIWIMDVLDDHSRVLVAARVCDGPTGAAAWDAFAHGVADWGMPAHVLSDNGTCFTGRFGHGEVDFERRLRQMGVHHITSSPAHPQTCGKIERSHQTTKRWLRTQPAAHPPHELQTLLDRWRQHYNWQRPHRGAHGNTPAHKWHAQPAATAADSPIDGPRRTSLHTIAATGTISFRHHYTIYVSHALAGERALVVANDLDLTIWTRKGATRLTIDPTRRYQPKNRHHPT